MMIELAKKSGFQGASEAARTLSRLQGRLPQWVSLLLVIVVSWQLALFLLQILNGPAQQGQHAMPIAGKAAAVVHKADIPAITDANLFGSFAGNSEIDTQPPPDVDQLADVPETTLDLTLKGTVWDSENNRAVAIIEYRNEEKVYTLGDQVVAGASLYRVEPRRVILQRTGGRLEELNLAETSQIPAGRQPVTRRFSQNRANNISRRSVIQGAAQSGALTEIIRPQPYFANSQLKGYRIYPGRQRRVFAQLGFRPGDLATNINGVPLTDPDQSMQLLNGIEKSGQLTVTVERNGDPTVISVDLGKIDSVIQQNLRPGTKRQ